MIEITIPGFKHLQLAHLVLDYNGTLAVDGCLLDGVSGRLQKLANSLNIHIVTADTFGRVQTAMADLPCSIHILSLNAQDEAKREFVRQLGADQTVCIGNGRNDRLMIQQAALGMAVLLSEGAFGGTLTDADVVCTSITDALDLLVHPLRLTATLRS